MKVHGTAARVCGAIAIALTAAFALSSEAATTAGQRIVAARDYPHKPVRIIDPYAAGGATDVMARLVATKFTERFGPPVIVDNRPGAGGNLGPEIAARATPDGYTLLMGVVAALAPSVSLYPKLGFDPMKDFAYVTLMAGGAYVLVVTPSVPAKSIPEFIALAKSRPGQLSYGSSGVGSAVHLAGELFKSRAGVNILHVPYKGGAPVMAAVMAGEVHMGGSSLTAALPLIKAGRVTALAVTSAKRAKAFPDLPTIAESGIPGYDITAWYGVLAPAATPQAIVRGLSVELGKILELPDVQAAFAGLGLEPTPSTPERFREIMRQEIQTSAKIIKDAGIKVE